MGQKSKPSLIKLPVINDQRGNLSFLEESKNLPFEIKRCYWTYDVPGGKYRGSHAFKTAQEIIIAISGSFDVEVFDGIESNIYNLKRSYIGLYIPPMHWRSIKGFSSNSLSLVLSSTNYSAEDYIRDKNEFLKAINGF
jgi:hypothetical protein